MDAQPKPQCSGENGPERSRLSQSLPPTEAHTKAATLRAFDAESAGLLHELNNVFVSVLLNTQVMEWKLPSYSRLKRNLHEVQRNAQRGGELAKRLVNRLEAISRRDSNNNDRGTGTSDLVVSNCAVADQEPAPAIRCEHEVIESSGCTAPVFSATGKKVPHTPV
jgi:signal transduction histidine kinase